MEKNELKAEPIARASTELTTFTNLMFLCSLWEYYIKKEQSGLGQQIKRLFKN